MSAPLVPLSPLSEEFGLIEYELQIQLNAPRMVLSEAYDISNPHIAVQFMSFCQGMKPENLVNVFVPTSELSQPVSEISSKGIKVDPKKGLKFLVGGLDIDRNAPTIEVLKLTIALGNTLNYQFTKAADEEPTFCQDPPSSSNLKPGYHSLCISDRGDYVIFNSSQIKTCNLIRFEGGKNLEEAHPDDDTCDLCGKNQATIWCVNDSAKLCPKCDTESHKENKILQRHQRIPLSEARSVIEFCPLHGDTRVSYYCPQCQAPVCFKCKMTGTHSKGDAASHPLIPIQTAYSEALEASKQDDPIFTRRKQIIEEKLHLAEDKLQSILDNQQSVEDEIMRIAQAAIAQTRELAGGKALIVRSTVTELIRKKEELDNIKKFIELHRVVSGPLAFLRAFDRQEMVVGAMQEVTDLPLDLRVEGDLCVFGSLEVAPTEQPRNSPIKPKTPLKVAQATPKKTPPPPPPPKEESSGSFSSSSPPPPPPKVESTPKKSKTKTKKTHNNEEKSKGTKQRTKKADGTPKRTPHKKNSDSESKKEETQSENIVSNANVSEAKEEQQMNISSGISGMKRKSDFGPEYTSLIALAQRREKKNKQKGQQLNFVPFQESAILTSPAQCKALYLCFPFRALPQTHLLFSTERDGRSIMKMHQMIDGIGITAVLIKKGEFIFGGFAAAKWNCDGIPFGHGGNSFLFSVSQDAFIPYKPRVKDSCNLYATKDTLTFGKYDLILADDFDQCSATIENSYGIGFNPGSTEAQTFLAGEPVFAADIVEVWGFFTIEQQK
ncbi:B-box zinc finger family protein [Histomonas meleagridis]|uniref:B-box zinc finger family protein n=1 Tax=Histomonas meleagridis TaxID=135588 RepID=UPI00355A0816|nr:B-box zinc finger family protein [Histomonas meleagridis]KAH0798670.1 B-box zinc finger family protein [Histomonas meleagridis]